MVSGGSMAQEKSWIDHVMALVLPVVVSVGGLAYTIHKDQVDEKVRNENRRADIERQEWDRDTAYVRLLTSSNPDEKKLGLAIIGQLVKQGTFPTDLKPVVAVIAGGLPSDDSTGIAAQLLKSAPALLVHGVGAKLNGNASQFVKRAGQQETLGLGVQRAALRRPRVPGPTDFQSKIDRIDVHVAGHADNPAFGGRHHRERRHLSLGLKVEPSVDLGGHAVILGTREVRRRRQLSVGSRRDQCVEMVGVKRAQLHVGVGHDNGGGQVGHGGLWQTQRFGGRGLVRQGVKT